MQSIVADSFDVTTLQGSALGLALNFPVSFKAQHETTLNNALSIFPNYNIAGLSLPKVRYYGVGITGCFNADDGILVSAYNPNRLNMNLYGLIPLRCRPVDEDLTDEERKQYRLRQKKIIGSDEYYLYYLKALQFETEIQYKRINNATGKEEAYTLDPSFLNPVPEKPNTSSTIVSGDTSIVAYISAKVEVEASEVLEYIRLFYNGDTRYARISELGFFSGIDVNVQGTNYQGGAISYTEAIYTQLYNHSTWTGTPLTHEGMKLDSTFEITSAGNIIQR